MQENGGIAKDIASRIRRGWIPREETGVLCDKEVRLKTKGKFSNTVVKSAMMYDCRMLEFRGNRDEMKTEEVDNENVNMDV